MHLNIIEETKIKKQVINKQLHINLNLLQVVNTTTRKSIQMIIKNIQIETMSGDLNIKIYIIVEIKNVG